MTVAEFYAAHAVDGRAVVRGTTSDPTRWIMQARGIGGVGYFVCHHDCTEAIRQVGADVALDRALRAIRPCGIRPRIGA